ncbi:PP2C family protein-serine/threonine phosphatase [Leucobacter sp. USHLN153]|uniref:PP2C family protein-serine/threonine phosphatase n=1 Tax=Leucobacter sp. USHLN153 TaxID=3081268 RepID=UPI0030182A0D
MFDEERRLAALQEMGVLDTPPDERVDRVARLAKEMFGVPMVSVSLLDRDRQWRKTQIGLGGNEAPREDSFCDYTVRESRMVVVKDASNEAMFADNPFVVGDPHLRFYAGHPLYAPGGEPVGTLCVIDTVPHEFTEGQGELLRDLAGWVQAELTRDEELDHAAIIQRALQPSRVPEIPGFEIAASAVARGQLSGDFYDLLVLEDSLRITVADAMGKGAGPAILAAGVRASLRTLPGRGLAEAMTEADRVLEEDLGDTGMFVTAVHADIDTGTGEIELVDAGHGLSIIVRADGSWEHLRSAGLPLGMGSADLAERQSIRTALGPGDTFACASDGLLDVLDPEQPLVECARLIRELGPEGVVRAAADRARGATAIDDVTVVVVRRNA